MSTYVQITREELEEWLDKLPLHTKWKLQPGKSGVYVLPLSDKVAVKLSSTIGSRDTAMNLGKASMHLSLISLITGYVLNRKAQGQDHFKRTLNWREQWKKGFERLKDAYMHSQGFYDSLASIEDRDKYKEDKIKLIESTNGWENNSILFDFHKRINEGGILSTLQENLLQKILLEMQKTISEDNSELLQELRALYVSARKQNNTWLMEFTENVGKSIKNGRMLSEKQKDILRKYEIKI